MENNYSGATFSDFTSHPIKYNRYSEIPSLKKHESILEDCEEEICTTGEYLINFNSHSP